VKPLDRRTLLTGLAAGAVAGCSGGGGTKGAAGATPAAAPAGTSPSPRASATAPTPSASPAAGLPFQLDSGPRTGTAVALTFHGQGDPAIATSLLGEAERAGARLTVLAVGTWLDEQPQLARRILDGGHELGNHTLHHVDISGMDAAGAYAEIDGCAQRLRKLTGSIGRWFRPSQAKDATALVAAQARRAGYGHALGYDVDSLDYTDPGSAAVVRNVLGGVRAGSVVSLQFGHAGTVTELPAILDGLHRRGLRAVTTSELFA
jgi:peptidoglycan/xylan/chitin deacetylase (PgdA/CDA1 family)